MENKIAKYYETEEMKFVKFYLANEATYVELVSNCLEEAISECLELIFKKKKDSESYFG